jgi:hypothetical protein
MDWTEGRALHDIKSSGGCGSGGRPAGRSGGEPVGFMGLRPVTEDHRFFKPAAAWQPNAAKAQDIVGVDDKPQGGGKEQRGGGGSAEGERDGRGKSGNEGRKWE